MTALAEVDRTIEQLFEQAPAGDAIALPTIAQALNASYTLLFCTDRRRNLIKDASCCGVDMGYIERLREAARERLLPTWLGCLVPGSVTDRAAFGTDREFARTPFYNHVIRPEGRFHCLIATPSMSASNGCHLVVGRPQTCDEFSAMEQRMLRVLLPHLREILCLQTRLARAQALVRHSIDLIGERNGPVMVVRSDGFLLSANEAARRLLSVARILQLDQESRTLTSGTVANRGRLRKALKSAAESEDVQAVGLLCADGPATLLTIRRLDVDPIGDLRGDQAHLLLHVDHSLDSDYGGRAAILAREHGLTRRETRLLECMLEGMPLKVATGELGVSYNTGRTHLRQIFGKLGVNRQSDLLRLSLTGRRPRR